MNTLIPSKQSPRAAKAIAALEKNHFHAAYFPTARAAIDELCRLIPHTASVGLGGSQTLEQLAIRERLVSLGNIVYCHNKPGLTPEEILSIRRQQLTCDIFLTSSNAITEDGKLVNTDATGNRVAAMIFGPKKVIVIAGINKLTATVVDAQKRIYTIAAPRNNQRLKRPNPCTTTGHCNDCEAPTRLCNVFTVMHRCPTASDIHVWIIGEELGY